MSDMTRLAAYAVVLALSLGAGTLLGAALGDPPADEATHSPAEHQSADHSETGAAQS